MIVLVSVFNESENDSPNGQRQRGGAGPSNRC